MGKLIKFNSADSHVEGHKRHRRKVCFVPKGEGPLCIEDAALYIAKVQGGAARKKQGRHSHSGQGPRSKVLGVGGVCPGHGHKRLYIIVGGTIVNHD